MTIRLTWVLGAATVSILAAVVLLLGDGSSSPSDSDSGVRDETDDRVADRGPLGPGAREEPATMAREVVVISEVPEPEREAVADEQADGPETELCDPDQLGLALSESNSLDLETALAVARGAIEELRRQHRMYESACQAVEDGNTEVGCLANARNGAILFHVLPDLPDLVRDGTVRVEIQLLAELHRGVRGGLGYGVYFDRADLGVGIGVAHPSSVLSLTIPDSAVPREMWERIYGDRTRRGRRVPERLRSSSIEGAGTFER